jgi:hypothetical protein
MSETPRVYFVNLLCLWASFVYFALQTQLVLVYIIITNVLHGSIFMSSFVNTNDNFIYSIIATKPITFLRRKTTKHVTQPYMHGCLFHLCNSSRISGG